MNLKCKLKIVFLIFFFIISLCSSNITVEKEKLFINTFIHYLNSLPNQGYIYDEAVLNNLKQGENNVHQLDLTVKAHETNTLDVPKLLVCTGEVQDGNIVIILQNSVTCQEAYSEHKSDGYLGQEEVTSQVSTEAYTTQISFLKKTITLENEVQPDTSVTSGEQFIAVPRKTPAAPCIGCSSFVDPNAQGVDQLASLGIRQLDRHEPNIKHNLNNVLQVERQVQVVNGVRFIITMVVDYVNCTSETISCVEPKICKISILEKPWVKLPDGSKYRAVVANNCTEQWIFEADEENLDLVDDVIGNTSNSTQEDGVEQPINKILLNTNIQSQPTAEKTLTEEEIKNIEKQIVTESFETSTPNIDILSTSPSINENDPKYSNYFTENLERLPEQKKKTIDELINFFNLNGINFNSNNTGDISRTRRSYSRDLNMIKLTEKFIKLKRSVENTKFLYTLAKLMVKNLNERDIESRVLSDIISAEEEFVNNDHFIYIQARLVLPCLRQECENIVNQNLICNGIINVTNKFDPYIMHNSCHNEEKKFYNRFANTVPTDDPVLHKLAKEALLKIEFESPYKNAIIIDKIIAATTQKSAGIVTKITMIIKYLNCSKTVPYKLRGNCSVLEYVNKQVCEVTAYKKSNDIQFVHTCTEFPKVLELRKFQHDNYYSNNNRNGVDSIKEKSVTGVFKYKKAANDFVGNETDIAYLKLSNEALKKFIKISNSNQHYQVMFVDKVTTQFVSGIVFNIEFRIAPTTCLVDEFGNPNSQECKILNSDELYSCDSEIWDQSWLNRKEINVSCNIDQRYRVKRELLGGPRQQDTSDPKYIALAKNSLDKYVSTLGENNKKYELIELTKVTTQVVSGIKTKINFTVSAENSLFNRSTTDESLGLVYHCYSVIWEQKWLDKKDISVDCRLQKKINNDYYENDSIVSQNTKKFKRNLLDDDIDEYKNYADFVINSINKNPDTRNLQRLITVHGIKKSSPMNINMITMYVETAYTYCLKGDIEINLDSCDEIEGLNHHLCLAKLFPKVDDDMIIKRIVVTCDDDSDFSKTTGINIPKMIKMSMDKLQNFSYFKLKEQSETYLVPSLNSAIPHQLSFVVATTKCSVEEFLKNPKLECEINHSVPLKMCKSHILFLPHSHDIQNVEVTCDSYEKRKKRSLSSDSINDEPLILKLVQDSITKLEMMSPYKYKQRMFKINSYSTEVGKGHITTIDLDVGYTTCLKFEWVDDITTCNFIKTMPRRHCVSKIEERLFIKNGKNIDVSCEDDETILEEHVEFDDADQTMLIAERALAQIQAKYPHVKKQKVVRVLSLEKLNVAGLHYKIKLEVGFTNCTALSNDKNCKLDENIGLNRLCQVDIWIQPWADSPPDYWVSCDYQDNSSNEIFLDLQAIGLFHHFVATYKPNYMGNHTETAKRMEIFKTNLRKIHDFNMYEMGTAKYGVTRFADLTYEEFRKKHLGLDMNLLSENEIPFQMADIPKIHDLPPKFDWREHGAVTEVKNQGSCGSCWAFSVTGNIEGQWKIKSGKLLSLSEQELVDCDKLDNGCNGGLPDNAYRAIEQLGGIETENDYPYEGEDDKCEYNKTLSRVKIHGAVNITSNETGMAQWLVKNGPISIGINANGMQFYMGGVSHPWKHLCSPKRLDHGVLIVGYGEKDYPLFKRRLPYWIVKNSWGRRWGEQGYYRIYRGDGSCGVNQMASSAVV